MRKTIVDILYNTVYQILIMLLPIITIPYLSRVLLPDQIGINGFIMSIIQFLSIVSLVGLNQYGVRKIRQAKDQGDVVLSKEFFSLFFLQIIGGCITLIIYFILSLFSSNEAIYYLCLLPYLLSGVLDISWFFQGIEKIRVVVSRNTVIKLGTLFLILIFVKSSNDFITYLLIMSVGTLFGNIVLWIQVKSYIKWVPINKAHVFQNFSTFYLLIPQIAMQLYITFDTTILGIFSTSTEVAYYSQAHKIARMLTTIISSISLVMMPKMVAIASDKNKMKKILGKSFEFTLFFSCLLSICLFVNAEDFVPWFFGNKYLPMIGILRILSLLILAVPVGGVFSNQFAIAMGKDKLFTIPVVVGAFISLGLNFLLIPIWGAFGAAFTVVCVELIVCFLRIILVRKYHTIQVFKSSIKYLIPYILCCFLGSQIRLNNISSPFILMALRSISICFLYSCLILGTPNEISNFIKNLIQKLRKAK